MSDTKIGDNKPDISTTKSNAVGTKPNTDLTKPIEKTPILFEESAKPMVTTPKEEVKEEKKTEPKKESPVENATEPVTAAAVAALSEVGGDKSTKTVVAFVVGLLIGALLMSLFI